MLLSARMLYNVGSVNQFDWIDSIEFTQGDTYDIYFQLIDLAMDKPIQQFKPAGRRYMPAAGAILTVTLANIDDAINLIRTAVQPFAQDPSIWKVSVLATDKIIGTCNLVLSLNESGKITSGRATAVVLIDNAGTL